MTIQQMSNALKGELLNYPTPHEFLAYNKDNVVRAMRYIMLKYALVEDQAKLHLLDESVLKSPDTYAPQSCQTDAERLELFDNIYIPFSIYNLAGDDFWLTSADTNIYALIFNINVWMVSFDADNNIDHNALGRFPHHLFYGNGVLGDPANARPPIPREDVYLIFFVNHYYAVTSY